MPAILGLREGDSQLFATFRSCGAGCCGYRVTTYGEQVVVRCEPVATVLQPRGDWSELRFAVDNVLRVISDAGAEMADAAALSFDRLPLAQTCRRIDFDLVEVHVDPESGRRVVLVSGIKPWADLDVCLQPVRVGHEAGFVAVEVVGRMAGFGCPVLVDFCVALPLERGDDCAGIEIVGATKVERRMVGAVAGSGTPAGS